MDNNSSFYSSSLNKRSIGLRGKLLIATLSLLLLPIAGYFYLLELETYLKNTQVDHQLENSRLMAAFFSDSPAINEMNQRHNGQIPIYLHSLTAKPLVDGFSDDWQGMYIQAQSFAQQGQTQEKFNLFAGIYKRNIYFMIRVVDKTPRYKLPEFGKQYDFVRLSFYEPPHEIDNANESIPTGPIKSALQHYDIATEAPGWFRAQSISSSSTSRIKGEWQDLADGYQLEFAIPIHQLSQFMAITVFDNGVPFTTRKKLLLNQAYRRGLSQIALNPIIRESQVLNAQLKKLHDKLADSKARLYVINREAEVLAHTGELRPSSLMYREPDTLITHLTNLYQTLMGLEIKNRRYYGYLANLDGHEIEQALGNTKHPPNAAAAWLAGSSSQTLILSTAAPIIDGMGNVLGAVVVEKTNASILALQDQLFEKILLISILLFFSVAAMLLIYSGRLVNRILKLQKATEAALTQEGKFQPVFPSSASGDEIGQLSRSFTTLMIRLDQYTSYLESLAGKLAHELRTPLSVIRSSLENMQIRGVSENQQKYMQRAQDGCDRLGQILRRMGEASRLEQAIQGAEKNNVELNAFIQQYFEIIQEANPEVRFQLETPDDPLELFLAPELIAQMLDKLIENAISFHTPGTPIKFQVYQKNNHQIALDIFNEGAWIDKEHMASVFDSMVSFRTEKQMPTEKKSLNLGLGLHIAKLISEYHGANLQCFNRHGDGVNWQDNGVSFVVRFERAPAKH